MTRPVVASIDLLALRQNLQIVRRAAPGSRLWGGGGGEELSHLAR
ncbi:MAG: hypothetical protein LBE69_18500, partial [Klebsiella sp.]